MERGAEPILEEVDYLPLLCVAAEARLAEHQLAVEPDLKPAVLGGLKANALEDRSPLREDLVGQAHGPVEIVSRDAELDQRFVLWVDQLIRLQ